MRLSTKLVRRYSRDGYVVRPGMFSDTEVALLRNELDVVQSEPSPGRVFEKDGRTVRALHGSHLANDRFKELTRTPRLVRLAMQLLDGAVYLYQFKINVKVAFEGDVWKWHQDYIYWLREDGMPEPRATNIVIFLDDVNEFNGPLMFVPGSHQQGTIETGRTSPQSAASWRDDVAADLKYSLDRDQVAQLVHRGGLVAPKGKRGTVVVFHPNIAHASAPNLSPFDRAVVIVTYNSVDNVPRPTGERRPEFLVSRDTHPIELTQ
jgi:ectoine hydroxylase-related dioxygenase (phytanoyl-CoA dioxygenase family)